MKDVYCFKKVFVNGCISLLCLFVFVGNSSAQNQVPPPVEDVFHTVDNTLDSMKIVRMARPVPGKSWKGDNPVLFLVGNSTMRTGTKGNGGNGQWGWGYFAPEYFDENKITVENHALGGTSSRTFYNRFWPDVLKGIRKGDWVIVELGHNDNGPYDSIRARASIPGIGYDSLKVTIKETGVKETVYTYGEYMRRFIRETRAKGAHPILCSLTPRNSWKENGTKVGRVNKTFGLWAKQVAEAEKVPFIDLNDITAGKYEKFGRDKVNYLFYPPLKERTHTGALGARINAESAVEGIRNCPGLELAEYLKPVRKDVKTGATRKEGRPVVFVVGDSTVKNQDKDEDGLWGWGSVIAKFFDPKKVSVENWGKPGSSARSFMNTGRWDRIYNALQPGDFVLIQFGHNDGGDIQKGKARGELKGTGDESKVVMVEKTGIYEAVYTYGWYLKKFIMDVQEKGAVPVILSPTPRNIWKEGKIERRTDTYAGWAREAAEAKGACFIDLNKLSADKMEKEGRKKVNGLFKNDYTHTSLKGARLNAESIIEGLKDTDCPLKDCLTGI